MNFVSPCISLCKIDTDKEVCVGCHRTLKEIIEWKDYSMNERMSIMQELKSRKESSYLGTPCPSCGNDNKCAIDAGKSANLCWCFSSEKSVENATVETNCYCKTCLEGV